MLLPVSLNEKLGAYEINNKAISIIRSSHRRCSVKKGVLRNFAKFTGKHLCQSVFFNKVAGLRPATLLKKRLWYRCFPVKFAKFLRTPFLQNTSRRLVLNNKCCNYKLEVKKYRKRFSSFALACLSI